MSTGGYLRVFIKEAVSKKRNPYVLIWEKEGRQGNRWNLMEKSISGVMIKVCWSGVGLMSFFTLPSDVKVHFVGIPDTFPNSLFDA